MSNRRFLCVALAVAALAVLPAPARASTVNEVGSILVYPEVLNETSGGNPRVESFLTISNTGFAPVVARVFFVSGTTCASCRFSVPLAGLESEELVVTRNAAGTTTTFRATDTGATTACPGANGFAVVAVADPTTNAVLASNVLTGSSTVVDYTLGEASSVSAIPFAGEVSQCRSCLSFDAVEFDRFPAVLGDSFIAPDLTPGIDAMLTLFTLGFDTGIPPVVDCDVIGIDEMANMFSTAFQFGCWTRIRLADISPEFAYPFLGVSNNLERGWLQLNCSVNGVNNGGVRGILSQSATTGTRLRRSPPGPTLASGTSWSRVLEESVTTGDSVRFCDSALGIPDVDSDGIGPGCDPCLNDPLNDSDADTRCGDVDNCPLVANANQSNADGDPYGDACDPCPLVANTGTGDPDHDGLGSACDPDSDGDGISNTPDPDDDNDGILDDDGDGSSDGCTGGNRLNCDDNCVFDFNPTQRDRDGDRIGDACDPTDDLVQGGTTSTTTSGFGILAGTKVHVFAWEIESGVIGYNVYRGLLTDLRLGLYGTCYRNRIVTPYTTIPENPAQGNGYFYLVSPKYSNREGSLGYRSNGTERPITAPCP